MLLSSSYAGTIFIWLIPHILYLQHRNLCPLFVSVSLFHNKVTLGTNTRSFRRGFCKQHISGMFSFNQSEISVFTGKILGGFGFLLFLSFFFSFFLFLSSSSPSSSSFFCYNFKAFWYIKFIFTSHFDFSIYHTFYNLLPSLILWTCSFYHLN